MSSLVGGPTTPLAPPHDKAGTAIVAEHEIPKIEEIRAQMNRPATKEELVARVKDLETEIKLGRVQGTAPTPSTEASRRKSFVTDLVSKVVSDKKYFYTALSMLVGELVFVTVVVRRGIANRAQWRRRMVVGSESERRLRRFQTELDAATQELLEVLRIQSETDRLSLLKAIDKFPAGSRAKIEAALKSPNTELPDVTAETVSSEPSWDRFFNAYQKWQEAVERELPVLNAAGPKDWVAPDKLSTLTQETEGLVRLVTGLEFSFRTNQAFNDALKHLDDVGKRETGLDLTIGQKVRRRLRDTLFLISVVAIPLVIVQTMDRGEENDRRRQDMNTAALADRHDAQNFIPSLFRPLLWTVVEVWKTEPRLAQFTCPLSMKPVEVDNPDLTVIQAIAYQVILESNARVDVTQPFEFRYDEDFFKRVFDRALNLNPALQKLDAKSRAVILADMAFKARRIFDEPKEQLPFFNPFQPPVGALPEAVEPGPKFNQPAAPAGEVLQVVPAVPPPAVPGVVPVTETPAANGEVAPAPKPAEVKPPEAAEGAAAEVAPPEAEPSSGPPGPGPGPGQS